MTDDGTAVDESAPAYQAPVTQADDLCRPFMESLPVTGASISVIGRPGQHSTIYASDAVATRVDALQFELGEGPRWEALRTGRPVLVPDAAEADDSEWPVFGAAVRDSGAAALFAFPLVLGAATVGVVDLYRDTPGSLSTSEVSTALSLAGSIASSAVRRALWSAREDAPPVESAPELRREVHQATGMVLVQLDTSATDAFARIRAHAFSSGRTVEDIARDVVTRRLNFRDLTK